MMSLTFTINPFVQYKLLLVVKVCILQADLY